MNNSDKGSPSDELIYSLLEHYQNGRLSDAEKLATEITRDFPKHEFAWKVLGVIFESTGRKSEALNANKTAVKLSPQDAEAHNNLGNILKELGNPRYGGSKHQAFYFNRENLENETPFKYEDALQELSKTM